MYYSYVFSSVAKLFFSSRVKHSDSSYIDENYNINFMLYKINVHRCTINKVFYSCSNRNIIYSFMNINSYICRIDEM